VPFSPAAAAPGFRPRPGRFFLALAVTVGGYLAVRWGPGGSDEQELGAVGLLDEG
jgi:hypothetical protein